MNGIGRSCAVGGPRGLVVVELALALVAKGHWRREIDGALL